MTNVGAQELYRRFGFEAAGVRKGYYTETDEDALIMWAHHVGTEQYDRLLVSNERRIRGHTVIEATRRW
jgi:hypothetical protein